MYWNVEYVYVLVTSSGPEFETRIKMNEAGNAKFNFLNAHDPYNAYYRTKIKEIQEGVAQEKAAAQQPGFVVSLGHCRISTLYVQ